MRLRIRTMIGVGAAMGALLGVVLAGGGATSVAAAPAGDAPDVVWICHPGQSPDPCETPLDTTTVAPDGTPQGVSTPARPPEGQRPVDCFYVYPTIEPASGAPNMGTLAGQAANAAVRTTVEWQSARFSQLCRVFAPAYRQVETGVWGANQLNAGEAYGDVLAAWKSYLANDNDGRGVILIGHSQGSLMLRELLKDEIGIHSDQLHKLVGAFVMGGNVEVRQGQTSGVDDGAVSLCTQRGQYGCVVAYSTFVDDPPWYFSELGNSGDDNLSMNFADLPHGYNLFTGVTYQVACTDPGVLSGSTAPFGITIPTAPFPASSMANTIAMVESNVPSTLLPSLSTTWAHLYQYQGSCQTINNAHVFRYNPINGSPAPGSIDGGLIGMGTHLLDLNLGTDKLVSIASQQTRAWLAANG